MATNNAINSQNPIQVSLGGTGAATLTANGVLYGNTTSPIGATSVGMAGQVLTSNGAGMAPNFQNSSGGSGWVLIQSQTASNSANINFTGITVSYAVYAVIFSGVVAQSTGASPHQLLFSTNGGTSYLSTGYTGGCNTLTISTGAALNTNSTTYLPISASSDPQDQSYLSGTIYLYGLGVSSTPLITGIISDVLTTGYQGYVGGGYTSSAITVNAIRFQFTSGNIGSGTYTLYGISQ